MISYIFWLDLFDYIHLERKYSLFSASGPQSPGDQHAWRKGKGIYLLEQITHVRGCKGGKPNRLNFPWGNRTDDRVDKTRSSGRGRNGKWGSSIRASAPHNIPPALMMTLNYKSGLGGLGLGYEGHMKR